MAPRVWSALEVVAGDLFSWRHFSSNTINSASIKKLPKRRGEYLYGVAPCVAALHAGRRQIYNIFLKSAVGSKTTTLKSTALSEVKQYAEKKRMDINYVSRDTLERMSSKRPHQGIVLDVSPISFTKIDFTHFNNRKCAEKPPIWLVLDGIQDPMNFGAILRCAFFLGAGGVIATANNCCSLTPVVSKASSGAMELMTVFSLSNMPDFLSVRAAKSHGWDVVGTCSPEYVDKKVVVPVQDVCDFNLQQPTLLVLGNEGYGVRKELTRSCTTLLTIPSMRHLPSGFDSLNVGVATGIVLHRLQTSIRTASKN